MGQPQRTADFESAQTQAARTDAHRVYLSLHKHSASECQLNRNRDHVTPARRDMPTLLHLLPLHDHLSLQSVLDCNCMLDAHDGGLELEYSRQQIH
jgi:hypothetical protein